ncbi:hypothetical protein V1517DRAFT_266818 [Lipomyces orientalis]|uniref:Uncharacterized protein n=1 Tax=Lipomyces orientalis TaxID=1233043 RepID=A0ACC3TD63_9ASCO
MEFILRSTLILLAVAYCAAADRYVSKTELCLFRGHMQQSDFTYVWLEEKHNQNIVPFFYLHDIGISQFKTVKISLNEGSEKNALLYLYRNDQRADVNVAFVNYDKTAYHFSGGKKSDSDVWRVVGGQRIYIDLGSCAEPEYNWEFAVPSSKATVQGYAERFYDNP